MKQRGDDLNSTSWLTVIGKGSCARPTMLPLSTRPQGQSYVHYLLWGLTLVTFNSIEVPQFMPEEISSRCQKPFLSQQNIQKYLFHDLDALQLQSANIWSIQFLSFLNPFSSSTKRLCGLQEPESLASSVVDGVQQLLMNLRLSDVMISRPVPPSETGGQVETNNIGVSKV